MASSSSITVDQWVDAMHGTPTPGLGCWRSGYPTLLWVSAPCDTTTNTIPSTMGGGLNDWTAKGSTYATYSVTGTFTSMVGYQSESDGTYGINTYALQLNTQQWQITFGTHTTNAWEQFIMRSNPIYAVIFVEYWLIGYSHWGCPPNWIDNHDGNCYRDAGAYTIGSEDPAYLTAYSVQGQATSVYDTATFCDANKQGCWASTGSDFLLLGTGNWWQSEFNVLGWGGGSQANFVMQTGGYIGININAGQPGQTCGGDIYTGEKNNLYYTARQFGSCKPAGQSVSFDDLSSYYLNMTEVNQGLGACGSISPSTGWNTPGSQVTIRATWGSGCQFLGWKGYGLGGYNGTQASHTITMESSLTQIATFYCHSNCATKPSP